MLSVQGLDVFYGRTQVLFGVSLDVPDGGLVCVMGRNGVGKTTLLNAVMGVLRPAQGRVTWEGGDITALPSHERVRAGLAYVPQGHPVFPQLTVKENLAVTLEATASTSTAVDEALDLFPRLKPLLGRRAGFLSGGQAQQLASPGRWWRARGSCSSTSPPRASSRRSSSRSRTPSPSSTPAPACR